VLRACLELSDAVVERDMVHDVTEEEHRAADKGEAAPEREHAVGRPSATCHRRGGLHRENGDVTVQPLRDEPAPALLRFGLAIAAITVTAQAVAHVVGVQLLDDRYLHLNADDELGLPAWVSSSATFAAAFGAFLLALMQERIDPSLLALAGLLAFFSLDDAIAVHERLGENVADALGYGETTQRLIWLILFFPLFALTAMLLVRTARCLPTDHGRFVYLGLGLLLLAIAAELVSSVVYELADVERGSWPDTIEVLIEESAELAAWILIATALLAAVLIGAREDREPLRRKVVA
jgi:hypothetical protein